MTRKMFGNWRIGLIALGIAILFSSWLSAIAQAASDYDGRWFARGNKDACGFAWAAEFTITGSRLKGRFWRNSVLFDIYGRLAADGSLAHIRTGRNKREHGVVGPRFLAFELQFDAALEEARGNYAVSGTGGALSCQTPLKLQKSLTE